MALAAAPPGSRADSRFAAGGFRLARYHDVRPRIARSENATAKRLLHRQTQSVDSDVDGPGLARPAEQHRRPSDDNGGPAGAVVHEQRAGPVSYTHLRAHETGTNLLCRLLLEK